VIPLARAPITRKIRGPRVARWLLLAWLLALANACGESEPEPASALDPARTGAQTLGSADLPEIRTRGVLRVLTLRNELTQLPRTTPPHAVERRLLENLGRDLGLRVESPDLPGLFREAAEGLFSVIVDEIPGVPPARDVRIHVEAERTDYLFVDWLQELLYRFETEHCLFHDFDVKIDGTRLDATARAWVVDESRDRLLHEVKAVTYHRLRVEPTERGWLAELILDI
jgi:SHS2 domain-containing protein